MKTIYFKCALILFFFGLMIGKANSQIIMNVDSFRTEFNKFSNEMRVVMISDPSCGSCMYMINQLVTIYEDTANCGLQNNIKYFFVWTKVLGGATLANATTHQNTYNDMRYDHYWDEFQLLGDRYLTTLGLVDPSGAAGNYTSWHTTMCYAPGVVWNVSNFDPPAPTFYMHKLSTQYNANQALYYTDSAYTVGFNNIACQITATEEIENEEHFSIYPNPAINNINISFKNLKNSGEIIIFDMLGNTLLVYDLDEQNGEIRIANLLPPGVYFCSYIKGNKRMETKKFIITE